MPCSLRSLVRERTFIELVTSDSQCKAFIVVSERRIYETMVSLPSDEEAI